MRACTRACACRCVHMSASAHSGWRRPIPWSCHRLEPISGPQKSFALSTAVAILQSYWFCFYNDILCCVYTVILCAHTCVRSASNQRRQVCYSSLFVLLNLSWCKDSAYHLSPQQSILVWPIPFWSWLLLSLLIKATAVYLVICEYIFDYIFQHIRKLLTLCIIMDIKNLVSWSKNLQQRYGSSGEVCCYLRRQTHWPFSLEKQRAVIALCCFLAYRDELSQILVPCFL